jgi:hypothetical protein
MTAPDPDFGVLQSTRADDPALRHWIGQAVLAATANGRAIDCQFVAPREGPTAAHRKFLTALNQRYPSILEAALPLLATQLKADLGALTARDLAPLFTLTAVWIPEAETSDMDWDLTFDCPAAKAIYMVDMRGWEPVGVEEE